MKQKDNLFFALCLALSAMGFLIANLMQGQLAEAVFAAVVMLLAAGYVTWFGIARVPTVEG